MQYTQPKNKFIKNIRILKYKNVIINKLTLAKRNRNTAGPPKQSTAIGTEQCFVDTALQKAAIPTDIGTN